MSLAEYLYELGTAGELSDEARARALLVQAALVLDMGADERLVLERLAGARLPPPYGQRIAECVRELHPSPEEGAAPPSLDPIDPLTPRRAAEPLHVTETK